MSGVQQPLYVTAGEPFGRLPGEDDVDYRRRCVEALRAQLGALREERQCG